MTETVRKLDERERFLGILIVYIAAVVTVSVLLQLWLGFGLL